ncbi:MAG: hypothetical protein B7Z35_01205 [Hydrogenophilales bacterium 12-61-10]|nr:MAG: hypothetical protein B7Z35_01205 [Hydrogenophilales bacterium 12-61-10]
MTRFTLDMRSTISAAVRTTVNMQSLRGNLMNERQKFTRRVFETALFFRDMYEEGNDGNTNAIKILKPTPSVENTAVRKFVLGELYEAQKLNLTDAAIQLAIWANEQEQMQYDLERIEADLRALCLVHERNIQKINGQTEQVIQRSFLRAARYIEMEGTFSHSRAVEIFVPDEFVPRGLGKNGPGHREHVVPCVYLREKCLDLFAGDATVEQVAQFLRRYVVIVDITKDEQGCLDRSIANGGKGLKNSMPPDWKLDTGCIFQRLHDANIAFEPPKEFPNCTH